MQPRCPLEAMRMPCDVWARTWPFTVVLPREGGLLPIKAVLTCIIILLSDKHNYYG